MGASSSTMRFASAISANESTESAVQEVIDAIGEQLTAGMVDLLFVFASAEHVEGLSGALDQLLGAFSGAMVVGCTGEGVIGGAQELERTASFSVLAGSLPEVEIRPYHLSQQQLESLSGAADWDRVVAVSAESSPAFFAFSDPFRFDVHRFLDGINEAFPGAPLVGGIASAATRPGENRLILGERIVSEGTVGVALSGAVRVQTVVSQGCRPIGKPFVITKGERNIVRELGGKSALEQLHEVFSSLSADEEKLARQSLFLGRVIDEYKNQFARGDFLIHNIVGADRKTGAIGIAGQARVGSTVQFHVRDAQSAHEDLSSMLTLHRESDVRGAILCGCNGRGTRMWSEPGHDVGVLREVVGAVPTAGFFCAGEFGPIGGRNFVHGFTASVALFSPIDS